MSHWFNDFIFNLRPFLFLFLIEMVYSWIKRSNLKIKLTYPVFGQKSNSFIIVLLRSHQEQHDDQDWCLGPLQDKALQKIQHQWLLPIRYEMPIHPRHGRSTSSRGCSLDLVGTTRVYQVNFNCHWDSKSPRKEGSWRLRQQTSLCSLRSHQGHLQRHSRP